MLVSTDCRFAMERSRQSSSPLERSCAAYGTIVPKLMVQARVNEVSTKLLSCSSHSAADDPTTSQDSYFQRTAAVEMSAWRETWLFSIVQWPTSWARCSSELGVSQ